MGYVSLPEGNFPGFRVIKSHDGSMGLIYLPTIFINISIPWIRYGNELCSDFRQRVSTCFLKNNISILPT